MRLSREGEWILFLGDGEVAASSWRDVELRDAIVDADAAGFEVVDFTVALDVPSDRNEQVPMIS